MTKNELLASRLKMLRKERNITQKELAEHLKISLSSVISYENAQRFPTAAVLSLMVQYFCVSRDYLLGKSNDRHIDKKWDDPEVMIAVRENLPAQLNGLKDLLNNCSPQEEKLTFDILEELSHVLRLDKANQRTTAISLLQSVFTASTQFVDICMNASRDSDPSGRIEKAKQTTSSQYSKALDEALVFLNNQITVVC